MLLKDTMIGKWIESVFSAYKSGKTKGDAAEEVKENALPPETADSPPSPPLDADFLRLPSDHALYKLWRMWVSEEKALAMPTLRLEGPPDRYEILTENEMRRELARLEKKITDTAVARFRKSEPVMSPQTEETEQSPEPQIPNLDAQAVVFSSKDQMHAWLFIYPPVGEGREVDRPMLNQAMRENEVVYGIDEALLQSLPQSSRRYFQLYYAAAGKQPAAGKDGYVVEKFSRETQRVIGMDEDNNADYTELNMVRNVEEGEVICEIVPPVPGVPGKTVAGRTLTPREGKKAKAPMGRNTKLSKDGKELIASKTGHLEFDGRNFRVMPLLDIPKNVDYSTGNLNFLGDIHVHGDVLNGFTVRAMGNIIVDGVVEASTVIAGGRLTVGKGIKGDGQALIKACEGIYAKYLESSNVCTQSDLHADCIINCNVYSDGTVQTTSGRGVIVGGKIQASSVKAKIIGSRSECLTEIKLGGTPSQDFEYEDLVREIMELEQEYAELERQPDNPAKARRLPMVRMKLSVNREKLQQYKDGLLKYGKEIGNGDEEQPRPESHRLACGIVYAGTEVTIGEDTLRVENETSKCTIGLQEGEVRFL
ncbi:MAG: DUF342 domain-containing protein [Lachnospiraceae bacterium]|nr:DUF342 domain-containing protein [Lachnospiraceae bacterium]